MKKKIAVIGAGASGLVSARRSLADGHAVTVYEQQSELGGVWFYSPDPTGYSAMYEKMITNMPKQLMEFEDLPWPDEAPAFLTGKQIQDYLKSYAEDIPIEFGVTVVRMEEDKGGEGKWKVRISFSLLARPWHLEYLGYFCTILDKLKTQMERRI